MKRDSRKRTGTGKSDRLLKAQRKNQSIDVERCKLRYSEIKQMNPASVGYSKDRKTTKLTRQYKDEMRRGNIRGLGEWRCEEERGSEEPSVEGRVMMKTRWRWIHGVASAVWERLFVWYAERANIAANQYTPWESIGSAVEYSRV